MKNILRFLSILTLHLLCAASHAGEKRPNILFLFSDDQRPDTIAALGNKHIQTPALDSLVASGTTMTRTYCMGSYDGAVCVPSRAMLLSGRTLYRLDQFLKQAPTWPQFFGKAGYVTFGTGKWHNSPDSLKRSFQQTRSIFMGGMGHPTQLNTSDKEAPAGEKEHSVKRFADAAIGFISTQKGETPWLCYVAFNAPHDPRIAPKEFHERYEKNPPPLPPNFLPDHPFDNGELKVRDEKLAANPRTEAEIRKHLADYYACITYMDFQIGRILEALKASAQWENTIIIFSSDHGLAIGSHGLMGKQNVYEHSMGAPLVVCGPGIQRDKKSDAFVYLLDIFPTLGELCSVSGPPASEGLSFARVLKGEATSARPYAFLSYKQMQRAINDGRWKLITYVVKGEQTTQLFDLSADPCEQKNLASEPQHAGELARMLELLQKAKKEFGDEGKATLN
ncbi:MAG TPA: sulfatase-like hydrolase/transferase [Planctomycetota bacterium]|nr:sulfatase-like hydrolase/transferase [Planctomycetota bacterium]